MSNVRRHSIDHKAPRNGIEKKTKGKIAFTPVRAEEIKTDTKAINKRAAKMMEIDEIVNREANGCFTVAANKNAPRYKAKQLYEYAQAVGKKTSELNDDELAKFIID